MLDDRVRDVLARLEAEDEAEQARAPARERSLAVGPESGRLLFALVAPNAGCEVLEIGGSRGYSTIWLAAAARILGGRVVSLEQDAAKIEAWRRNIADAGLEEWAELARGRRAGDAAARGGASTSSSSTRGRTITSGSSGSRARSSSRAGVIVADNVDIDASLDGVRRGTSVRPDARLGHGSDRQRARGDHRPALSCVRRARAPARQPSSGAQPWRPEAVGAGREAPAEPRGAVCPRRGRRAKHGFPRQVRLSALPSSDARA